MNGILAQPALELRSVGKTLDLSEGAWGELMDSSSIAGDVAALQRRMDEEGYLFIRGFFPRELIRKVRISLLEALNGEGAFEEPLEEGRIRKGSSITPFSPDEARKNEAIQRVVFGPEIKTFYQNFLGGPIRHFDYIWMRTMGHGQGTRPHCDIVYMGRGTHRLHTAWIPYGDVPLDLGGLMILEKSHLKADKIRNYLESDVDTYCENIPGHDGWKFGGALSTNPATLREKLGGRWLTAEFRMGDLLTFRMDTIHGSLDNQTDRIRLSTDTRYQLTSEPVDERWVGENPIAHGPNAKRGLIC